MKLDEIRSASPKELEERVLELRKTLFDIRFQKALGNNEKVKEQKLLRKEIARILTVRKERGV
jgi:large subunit ribosomal protein L29